MKSKHKLVLSIVGIVIILAIIVLIAVLAENKVISEKVSEILSIALTIPLLLVCLYAGRIDYESGLFECRKCGHIFKPTKSEYIWGLHSITTRYLKCPKCEEKSWCIRRPDPDA